jgi:hypothetical protein
MGRRAGASVRIERTAHGRGFETTRVKGCLWGQSAGPARPAPETGGKITLPVAAAGDPAMLRCTIIWHGLRKIARLLLAHTRLFQNPFALSLSKGRSFFITREKKNGASTSSARTDEG